MTAALLQQHRQEPRLKANMPPKIWNNFPGKCSTVHSQPPTPPFFFRPSIDHFKKLPQNEIEKSIHNVIVVPPTKKLCCPFAAASHDAHSIYL